MTEQMSLFFGLLLFLMFPRTHRGFESYHMALNARERWRHRKTKGHGNGKTGSHQGHLEQSPLPQAISIGAKVLYVTVKTINGLFPFHFSISAFLIIFGNEESVEEQALLYVSLL